MNKEQNFRSICIVHTSSLFEKNLFMVRSTDGFRILLSTNQAYDSDNAVMKWDCVVKDNLQDGRFLKRKCRLKTGKNGVFF